MNGMKKYVCPHCGKEFEGACSLDILGWRTACAYCECSFDVDEFDKRYVIALADDDCDDYEKNFTDDFSPERVKKIYYFATEEELVEFEKKLVLNPESMWYWIIDAYPPIPVEFMEQWEGIFEIGNAINVIISGAIDQGDVEVLEEYFNKEKK